MKDGGEVWRVWGRQRGGGGSGKGCRAVPLSSFLPSAKCGWQSGHWGVHVTSFVA